jgi:hypothetical protein
LNIDSGWRLGDKFIWSWSLPFVLQQVSLLAAFEAEPVRTDTGTSLRRLRDRSIALIWNSFWLSVCVWMPGQ